MTYPPADTKTAWYQDDYPGADLKPNVGVVHTTEGTTRPTYAGGSTAPNYTAVPDMKAQRLRWFAHFPDTKSSRALQNDAGGVETNTLGALQVELVGTCAPGTAAAWRKAGRSFIYWPEAPDWALDDLAEFVAWAHREHGIPVHGPSVGWKAYPESYGTGNGVRMTGAQWSKFYGWCGHQHVPENDHGDPGALDWAGVTFRANQILDDAKDAPDDQPLVIDLSVIRQAFLAALDQHQPATPPSARPHVRRLQRALRSRYPDQPLVVSGQVGGDTLAAWARHESLADGSGRPSIPDAKSLKALVAPRFTMRK